MARSPSPWRSRASAAACWDSATAFVTARVMRSVDEPGLRLMISLALVTGTYRLADLMGVSGPTAVVACGLVLRMQAPRDADGRSMLDEVTVFWHVIDELLNALLFVLIGFELFAIQFRPRHSPAGPLRPATGAARRAWWAWRCR